MAVQSLTLADGTGDIETAARLTRNAGFGGATVNLGAIADATAALANFANQPSVAWRIDQEIAALQERINGAIANWAATNPAAFGHDAAECGCLVHAVLSAPLNWPAGDPPLGFVTLFDADCGLDPVQTLLGYLAVPSAIHGTPEGTQAIWRFLWVTQA